MIKKVVLTITLLFSSSHIFSMFKPRVVIDNRNNNLAKLAEIIAKQLTEQPVIEQTVQASNKKVDFNAYKHQKKYPIHPLDKPGTSKYTKNRKDRRKNFGR